MFWSWVYSLEELFKQSIDHKGWQYIWLDEGLVLQNLQEKHDFMASLKCSYVSNVLKDVIAPLLDTYITKIITWKKKKKKMKTKLNVVSNKIYFPQQISSTGSFKRQQSSIISTVIISKFTQQFIGFTVQHSSIMM